MEDVVHRRCQLTHSKLVITDSRQAWQVSESLTGQVLDYRSLKNVVLKLLGTYQYENATVV